MTLAYPLCTTCYIVSGDRLTNERIAFFLCKRLECHCKCGHGGDSLHERALREVYAASVDPTIVSVRDRVTITQAGRDALLSA